VTRHTSPVEPKSRRPRGIISKAAREFGVTREHMSRVLNGHRESRSLLRRFNAKYGGAMEGQG